jgi:ketosteroid isomerase-like protein
MFEGDLTAMETVWSHAADVTYLGPDGSFNVGWEAALKNWQKQAAMNLGGKVEPKEIHVTVGHELGVVHNYEVGENVIDGNPIPVKIRATNIYRKENGKWKMTGHDTDRLPVFDE